MMISDGKLPTAYQQLLARKVRSTDFVGTTSSTAFIDPQSWGKAFKSDIINRNSTFKPKKTSQDSNAMHFESVDDALLFYQQQIDKMDTGGTVDDGGDIYNISFQPQQCSTAKNPCTTITARDVIASKRQCGDQRRTIRQLAPKETISNNKVVIGRKRRLNDF